MISLIDKGIADDRVEILVFLLMEVESLFKDLYNIRCLGEIFYNY